VLQATGKTLRDQLQTASFHLQADTPDGRFHLQVYASGIDTTAGAPDSPESLLYRMIPDADVARELAARQDPNEVSLIADQSAAPIWQRMRDACVALATEMGGRGINPNDPHETGSTWHDSGTLFIGDDPGASVTDTSGRFHHIANAVCVDQALFPSVGSANPVLTGSAWRARPPRRSLPATSALSPRTLARSSPRKQRALPFCSSRLTPANGCRTMPA
jgi:choline dehydrogenase-like flavoprotein